MADFSITGAESRVRVDPHRSRSDTGSWMVKTTNSYFRVVCALGRYFITKVEHYNGQTRDEAITNPGDSWSGHTLVLQVGYPMVLYSADGSGVVRTTTVLDIQE